MKLSVELAPNGGLAVYLPGALYPTQLSIGRAEETLITILRAAHKVEDAGGNVTIGSVAAPTTAQLNHWLQHTSRTVRGCPWCKPTPNLGFQAIEEFIPQPKVKVEKKGKRK